MGKKGRLLRQLAEAGKTILRGRGTISRVDGVIQETESTPESGDSHNLGVSEKVVNRVESVTRVMVEKTMAPKWAKQNLAGQVGIARKMMRAAGLVNFRSNFLKPGSFPDDLRDKKKQGATNEEIFDYYWNCPEFVEFWKTMELGEDHLRALINDNN